MSAKFSHFYLRQLEIAEHECPWGEMAENYRMQYLAHKIVAASDGYTEESRESNNNAAMRIWLKLFGKQPTQRPQKLSDIIGSR